MSEENNIEDILRSKFDDQEFPFDESNWDKVEETIDNERKKEKRKRRFLLFFIGIMTGIGISLAFFYSINSSVSEDKKITEKKQGSNNSSKSQSNSPERIGKNENDSTKNETEFYDEATANELQTKSDKNSSNSKNDITENKKTKTDKLNKNKNESSSNSSTNPSIYSSEKETNGIKNTDDKKNSQYGNANSSINILKNSDSTISINKQNTENKLTSINTESLSVIDLDTNLSQTKDSTLKNSTDTLLVKNDSIPKIDVSNEIPTTPFLLTKNWFILAGGIYNKGFTYNDTLDGNGFSPAVGIGYSIQFKEKLNISIGLNYQLVDNLSYSYKSVVSHQPRFGLNDSIMSYQTNRLHYLVLPIQLNFNLNEKNSIGIGFSASWLASSVSNIGLIRENNFGQEIISDSKGRNYLEGFNRVDVSINLGYRRKISNRWGFVTEMNFGLLDIKDNSFFTNSRNNLERNLYIRSAFTFKISK